jgi:hypothetical protein
MEDETKDMSYVYLMSPLSLCPMGSNGYYSLSEVFPNEGLSFRHLTDLRRKQNKLPSRDIDNN